MGNLFDIENFIIKDESALTEVFVPERLLHRDGERDYLASCLKPIVINQSIRNVFLFGPTGTGKTSLVRWMFKELESHTANAKTIYINCWKSQTTHAILYEIVSKMSRFTNPRRQTKELFIDVANLVKASGKKLILALDEADKLLNFDILYDFSREGYGLVLISNSEQALAKIDPRIRSSIAVEAIEFPRYTANELSDILIDRVMFALLPSKISQELIKVAANAAGGDARVGLEILRRAAKLAEGRNAKNIDKEDIIHALKAAKRMKIESMLADIEEDSRILYKIIEEKASAGSGEIFEEYKRRAPNAASERTFRYNMEELVKAGFIEASGDVRWRKYSIKI
ncbi:MAG: AAA family ATPase [Nanoarchaeota archaeon]|nr:AAA family ATPase [Nanoarchaeota archaeon]MBU4300985.1 AAA family ATPase [Nanoarchaeota archaeon]MBU4451191.1 AAA family ATPase [Nanoarchaeota archaeon]MCG2723172.1 AAA family ATPase [archaeon]